MHICLLRRNADYSAGHLGTIVTGPELRVPSVVLEPDVSDALWVVLESVPDLKRVDIAATLDSRRQVGLEMSTKKLS